MKLIFWLLFALMIFCSPLAAQNAACSSAQVGQAPVLFNLKLGMSPAAARSVLGKDLKIKDKRRGEYTFFQNYIEKKAPHSLRGVRALYLRFFDGSLYQIEIFYEEEETKTQSLANFINLQSAKLNFPPTEVWKIEYGIAEINCGEFSLVADRFLNPRLQLTDLLTLAKVEAKRKKD